MMNLFPLSNPLIHQSKLVYNPFIHNNLCNLRDIDLSENNFGGIGLAYLLESLVDCKSPSLESLSVSSSGLSGPIPNSIERLSSLKKLDLSDNTLNGSIPDSIGQLSSLKTLYLSVNKLTGNLPASLGQLSKLSDLDFSFNLLSGLMTEAHFAKLVSLKHLYASNNNLTLKHQVADWIPPFQLIYLSLNSWVLGHEFPLWLQSQRDLMELDISNTCISSPMPPESFWRSFPNLMYLDISQNNITGTFNFSFPVTLVVLDLSSNMFTGNLPSFSNGSLVPAYLNLSNNSFVGPLHNFLCFNLRLNKLDGNIPDEFCYLSTTQILDLASNNLSGNIPRCLSNFSVLSGVTNSINEFVIDLSVQSFIASDTLVIKGQEYTYKSILGLVTLIDLSSNNISGHIPSELTTLRELKSLNLSRNQLTGNIPEKIGDMKALESFDLSVNKLSGELPMSLSRLNFLSSFNVSYNKLTGSVPLSTQLQSLNESSFFGNKLCGDPLSDHCLPLEVPTHTIEDQKEDDGSKWGLVISIVLGFVLGFWIIVAPLILSTSRRIAYYSFMRKLINV